MTTQKTAKLRVCASCEWIFKGVGECPKCQFGSYGARFVYGDKCYRYHKNQKPWMDNKLFKYKMELIREINNSPESSREAFLI